MAHVLIMPRQGNTVESCVITDWKVGEGDEVRADTIVCEVETDKAAFEVPAGAAGTVLKLLHEAGADVPVLAPIAFIGAAGENWEAAAGTIAAAEGGETRAEGGEAPPPGNPARDVERVGEVDLARRSAGNYNADENLTARVSEAVGFSATPLPGAAAPNPAIAPVGESASGAGFVSPRARNLAAKEALPLAGLSGSGPGGRIIERDVDAALAGRPLLTAAAKAAMPGVLPPLGSGLGGRVTLADLEAGAVQPASGGGEALPAFGEGAVTVTEIRGVRKIIAGRMFKSLAESAQFTLNASANAAKLKELRARIKTLPAFSEGAGLSGITINDLVLFAVSRILPRFPFMNAHKIGDTIKTFERVHLASAVDTPRGLMVPVIRNANLLTLAQIASEAKRLAAACQAGRAKPDELTGSTFTVSNLGSLGISGFTPVLNAPEVAILGVCGIELKPVELPPDEAGGSCCGVRFEPHIGFSLTINHEAVDGAPAGRFLKALCDAVANIDLLLAAG